jgi:hypothetical protein
MLFALGGENNPKLYGSFDGGNTWKVLRGTPNPTMNGLVKLGDKVYINNDIGFYLSGDSGQSWSSSSLGSIGNKPVLRIGNKLICSDNQNTTENGINFTLTSNRKRVFNQFAIGNSIYALKRQTDSLFSSPDFGSSWSFISKIGFGYSHPNSEFHDFRPRTYHTPSGALFIRNNGSSNGPLLRSLNNGLTWATCNNGLPNGFFSASLTAAVGNILFTSNAAGGLFRTTDLGANWVGLNSPVSSSSITSLFGWKNRIIMGTINPTAKEQYLVMQHILCLCDGNIF